MSLPLDKKERERALLELSNCIGSTEIKCPYCQSKLKKAPKRRMKCTFCKKDIYSKVEPLSGEIRLFKENDLKTLEELKAIKENKWDSWYRNNRLLIETKYQLGLEWGIDADNVSNNDAIWRINRSLELKYLRNKNYKSLLDLKVDDIRLLYSENKLENVIAIIPEVIVLAYGRPTKEKQEIIGLYSPVLYLIYKSKKSIEELSKLFIDSVAANTYCELFFARKSELWDLFLIDYTQYLNDINCNEKSASEVKKLDCDSNVVNNVRVKYNKYIMVSVAILVLFFLLNQ